MVCVQRILLTVVGILLWQPISAEDDVDSCYAKGRPSARAPRTMERPEDYDPVKISALGRPFKLGQFYDMRTDKLFEDDFIVSDHAIGMLWHCRTSPEVQSTKILQANGVSLEKRMDALVVDSHTRLSIVAGLVSGVGAATYLEPDFLSNQSLHASQTLYKIYLDQNLFLFDLEGKTLRENSEATHVVSRVQTGSPMAVSFETKSSHRTEEETLEMLDLLLSYMAMGSDDKIPDSIKEKAKDTAEKLEDDTIARFHGVDNDFCPIQTINVTINLWQMLLGLSTMAPEKKPIPVTVELTPLNKVGLNSQGVFSVAEATVDSIVSLKDKLTKSLSDIKLMLEEPLVEKTKSDKVYTDIAKQIEKFNEKFSETLKDIVPKVRVDKNETKLNSSVANWVASPFYSQLVADCLAQMRNTSAVFGKLPQDVPFAINADIKEHVKKANTNLLVLKLSFGRLDALRNAMTNFNKDGTVVTDKDLQLIFDSSPKSVNHFAQFVKNNPKNGTTSFLVSIQETAKASSVNVHPKDGETYVFTPIGIPKNPNATLSKETLKVLWDEPKPATGITAYELVAVNSTNTEERTTVASVNTTLYESAWDKGSGFVFVVRAETSLGFGDWSDPSNEI